MLISIQKPVVTRRFVSRFLHRIMRFLFSFLITSCILFIVGNVQEFLDSSQLIILRQQIVTGIMLCAVAVSTFVLDFYFVIFLGEKHYSRYCIFSVCFFLAGLLIAIISSSIVVLSAGVVPPVD